MALGPLAFRQHHHERIAIVASAKKLVSDALSQTKSKYGPGLIMLVVIDQQTQDERWFAVRSSCLHDFRILHQDVGSEDLGGIQSQISDCL